MHADGQPSDQGGLQWLREGGQGHGPPAPGVLFHAGADAEGCCVMDAFHCSRNISSPTFHLQDMSEESSVS